MNGIGRVRVLGPLALHADGVRSELSRLGYALGTVENHVRVIAHLSQWMADESVEPGELSQDRVEQFFAVLKRQWKRPPTAQTLGPTLRWLRECQVVPPLTMITPQKPLDVLLEVNASGEDSKQGFAPADVPGLAATAAALKNVHVRGLMTMAAPQEPEACRPTFATLRKLRGQLRQQLSPGHEFHELSMGMTNDFEVAIEEGATMIRLGTVYFEGLS